MMKRTYTFGMSLLCAAALGIPTAGLAGPGQDKPKHSKAYPAESQAQKKSAAGKDTETMAKYGLEPESRITIAVDYDNDGQYDAYESVQYYQFERVRTANRQHGKDARMNRSMKHQARHDKDEMGKQGMTAKVSGEIADLRVVRLAHSDEDHVVARINREKGGSAATALLGTESQLARLNLETGSRITVKGHRGHVNDKSMLIANTIESGDQNVTIDIPVSRHLKRAQGEVISTRTVTFQGASEPFVVAEVELASGKRQTVNLGPESRIARLDLEQGDRIQLLVRPGQVDGKAAMIAEQVRADGELVLIPKVIDTDRYSS